MPSPGVAGGGREGSGGLSLGAGGKSGNGAGGAGGASRAGGRFAGVNCGDPEVAEC